MEKKSLEGFENNMKYLAHRLNLSDSEVSLAISKYPVLRKCSAQKVRLLHSFISLGFVIWFSLSVFAVEKPFGLLTERNWYHSSRYCSISIHIRQKFRYNKITISRDDWNRRTNLVVCIVSKQKDIPGNYSGIFTSIRWSVKGKEMKKMYQNPGKV